MGSAFEEDRLVQLMFARDDRANVADARLLLDGIALELTIDQAVAGELWAQAASLAIVACGSRMFRGGVFIRGAPSAQVRLLRDHGAPLVRALERTGARSSGASPPGAMRLHVGSAAIGAADLRVSADGWRAVVTPEATARPAAASNPLVGVLAGAIAVSEAFRKLALRNPAAGRRRQELNAWEPGAATAPTDATISRLPAALWLVGAGNLGQATLFTLATLPFADAAAVTLVIQDFDRSGPENRATQVLTTPAWFGRRKAAAAAEAMAELGFDTFAVERAFWAGDGPREREPRIALAGLDNLEARRSIASAGFDLVIDAGLGGTPAEIFDLAVRTFPGGSKPEDVWPPEAPRSPGELPDRYADLVRRGLVDPCGAITIAGRQVGVPSTALAAAALQLAQLCRALATGGCCDEIDMRVVDCALASSRAHLSASLSLISVMPARP